MKLLVANRAEIAVRVMATAAVLGIETAFEIDDVIDPAQTRHVLMQTLTRTRS